MESCSTEEYLNITEMKSFDNSDVKNCEKNNEDAEKDTSKDKNSPQLESRFSNSDELQKIMTVKLKITYVLYRNDVFLNIFTSQLHIILI